MTFRISAIVLMLFVCAAVHASVSDSVKYYAGLKSTGTFNRTNLGGSSYLFNNSLRLSVRKKNVACNIQNRWLYGEQNKLLTNNDYSSALDVNLYTKVPNLNYWGLFNFLSSHSLKINRQLQLGVGASYNIVKRKQLLLNISDGFIYDYNNITASDSTHDIYYTVRNSVRIRFIGSVRNKFSVSATGFYQPSLSDANDYIIRSDLSLSVKLASWFSITAMFNYNRMNRTRAENLFFNYGLTLERNF